MTGEQGPPLAGRREWIGLAILALPTMLTMLDNGFLERERFGDLRDLILRPYAQRDTVVVKPDDMLITAYNRMKLYDVSQLPVMEDELQLAQ